jgi:hypothetical protein
MIKHALAAAALAALFTAPAFASETVIAPFTTPDGAITTGTYDNIVQITVSGVGQSLGTDFNDAFYVYTDGSGNPVPPFNDPSFYQLTFGTTTLVPLDPAQDIKNFLVGPIPAFDSGHTYTFDINTGVSTPTQLHFGVSDGDFADNSGAFTVTIAQVAVPEASTWAMMLLGIAGLAFAAANRSRGSRSWSEVG